MHYIQYRSKNCIAIKEVIEKFIEMEYKEYQKMKKSITVRKFDLQWMLDHRMKFLHLTEILNEAGNDQIFIT